MGPLFGRDFEPSAVQPDRRATGPKLRAEDPGYGALLCQRAEGTGQLASSIATINMQYTHRVQRRHQPDSDGMKAQFPISHIVPNSPASAERQSTNRAFIVNLTPNLSVTIPNASAQKVFSSDMSTQPPIDRFSKNCFARSGSFIPIARLILPPAAAASGRGS